MSQPTRALFWMASFLIVVGLLAAMIWQRLAGIFAASPFFNGVILAVLAVGIIANFRQVLALSREVDWIDAFRRSHPDRVIERRPRLLAPMARMLMGREKGRATLSAPSLRTLLDSVQLKLEESRDLSRYLIGLAIFLGLLGTFWGLLIAMFANLKDNIKVPLRGMSTSFSTSLFGLSSSLVIGFLDLQANHAQNRFYNELEDWLSGMTHLASGSRLESEEPIPAYVQALLEQAADGLERMQRALVDNEHERRIGNQQLGVLASQIERLNELMNRDVRERQMVVAAQDDLRNVLRQIASQPQAELRLADDLRSEFRLLSRTIAAAMESRHPRGESAR